jgi:hypothetical protein
MELPGPAPVIAQGVAPGLGGVPVHDVQPDEDRFLDRVQPGEFLRPARCVLISPVVLLPSSP